MEVLIKYCKKKHNIFEGCDTLRLGTLDYYREMNPKFTIADPGEATFKLTSGGNPLNLSLGQMERLTEGRWTGTGGPNRRLMKVEEGGNLIKSVEFPNCYIFCTCRFHEKCNKKEFAREFDPNYDSSYMIVNIPLFTRSLVQILMAQFKLEDLIEGDLKRLVDLSLFDMKDIGMQVYSAPVTYIDSREKVFSQKTFEESLRNIPNKYQVLFMKENRDKYQREFRFVFALSHPLLGILSVKKDAKNLNINLLKSVTKNVILEA